MASSGFTSSEATHFMLHLFSVQPSNQAKTKRVARWWLDLQNFTQQHSHVCCRQLITAVIRYKHVVSPLRVCMCHTPRTYTNTEPCLPLVSKQMPTYTLTDTEQHRHPSGVLLPLSTLQIDLSSGLVHTLYLLYTEEADVAESVVASQWFQQL